MLHENKHINFFLKLLYAIVFGAIGFFFFKYAFKWMLPLLVAFLMSQIIIKPVSYLSQKTFLSRNTATGLCTLLALVFIGGAFSLAVYKIIVEGAQFVNSLPTLIASLPDKLGEVKVLLDRLAEHLPHQMQNMPILNPDTWLSSLKLPQIDISKILSSVSWAAGSVPLVLLTTVFIFLSTFFFTSQRDEISAFIRRQMTPRTEAVFSRLKSFLFSSVFRWIKAQMIIICVTFCELAIGFFVIRQPYALFLAAGISIIDALPILGVGTILIPWALFSLITGDFVKAISLCALYAVVLVVRNSIEPKIVGGQIGLNPFVTLICIYFGYRAGGFLGMFLLPVTVLALIKLHEWDIIHIWK